MKDGADVAPPGVIANCRSWVDSDHSHGQHDLAQIDVDRHDVTGLRDEIKIPSHRLDAAITPDNGDKSTACGATGFPIVPTICAGLFEKRLRFVEAGTARDGLVYRKTRHVGRGVGCELIR